MERASKVMSWDELLAVEAVFKERYGKGLVGLVVADVNPHKAGELFQEIVSAGYKNGHPEYTRGEWVTALAYMLCAIVTQSVEECMQSPGAAGTTKKEEEEKI